MSARDDATEENEFRFVVDSVGFETGEDAADVDDEIEDKDEEPYSILGVDSLPEDEPGTKLTLL